MVAGDGGTSAGENYAEGGVGEGGENALLRRIDPHYVAVEVVDIVLRTTCLRGGEDTADAAGGAADMAGEVGAVGVGFEERIGAVGDGEDKPVLVDVAVGDGGAVGGVFHLFASAPEGVVAVGLDEGAVFPDFGQAVFAVPDVGEHPVGGHVAVCVVGIGAVGDDDRGGGG